MLYRCPGCGETFTYEGGTNIIACPACGIPLRTAGALVTIGPPAEWWDKVLWGGVAVVGLGVLVIALLR